MKALALFAVILMPAVAFGQPAIAGTVKDSSGAPLAGVEVEASGPALIERNRTAVTDAAGRYRIEDLRPGRYRVTFRLEGWQSFAHDGVELTGSLTAIVSAQLAIGALTAEVTVTAASPSVDLRSPNREVTLSGAIVRSIPTVRSYNAILPLIPGVVTSTNDTITGTATTAFPIYGGRSNEGRLLLDGMNIGSPPAGNSAASYVVDVGNAQEVAFSSAAVVGEFETAGLVMNIVPKAGGNTTRGSLFGSATGGRLQSNNITRALRAQGVVAGPPLTDVYDVSGTIGGPIARDRVWYFVNAHTGGNTKASANVFYNLNASDPSKWLYAPDVDRREYSDRTFEDASARITWQASPRQKVGVFWDAQALCRSCTGATPGNSEPARVSPEAVGVLGRRLNVAQATWSSPATNHVLLEAGFSATFFGVGNFERQPNPTRNLIRVLEQCARGCPVNGGIPGLVYRSQDFSVAHAGSYVWTGSVSRVTGTHSVKAGYQYTLMIDDRTWLTNTENLTYRVNDGVPNQLTQSISPWVNDARGASAGLFVQDSWTRERLTLQGALRFDRARSWFPAQQEGPSRFLPAPIVFPETVGIDSYKDITVRAGATYDLFGGGTTALKVALGRYLEGAGISGNYANTNPTLRLPQTTMVFGTAGVTRSWIDANGNFGPDCDLLNAAAQDLRDSGGDLCGVLSNTSFGTGGLTNRFDPGILDGWGVRPSDWNLGVSIEHELAPRAAVTVAYRRRWFHGFSVVDNLALQPSELTPFHIVAPVDARLPDGGGYVLPGLYDVIPEKSGRIDNLVTDSARYGAWYQYFNGIDATLNIRRDRFTFIGGTSTGQAVADNCDVRAQLPELATTTTGTSAFGPGLVGSAVTPVSPYCHVAYGILTQLRGLSSYHVPKVEMQLAATFQSKPGPMLAADYAVPNEQVAATLGRSLSGDAPNVTVNLIAPGARRGDRINEIDIRIAKLLKFGRSHVMLAVDLYNALNSSAVLTYNTAFVSGMTWPQPLTILTPRFLRLTGEIDF
jgi:Carboxypeptidase regulatory-like domain